MAVKPVGLAVATSETKLKPVADRTVRTYCAQFRAALEVVDSAPIKISCSTGRKTPEFPEGAHTLASHGSATGSPRLTGHWWTLCDGMVVTVWLAVGRFGAQLCRRRL